MGCPRSSTSSVRSCPAATYGSDDSNDGQPPPWVAAPRGGDVTLSVCGRGVAPSALSWIPGPQSEACYGAWSFPYRPTVASNPDQYIRGSLAPRRPGPHRV